MTKRRCSINDRVDMGAYESPSECFGADFDGDGLPDMCDADIDDDEVLNEADVCDFTPVGAPVDSSGRPLMDIDEDCDTDLADFTLFQLGFTGPGK